MKKTVAFLSLLFGALVLAPSAAHVLEMHQKMQLARQDYGIVQQIYRGWAFLGVLQLAALVVTFLKLLQEKGVVFKLTLAALLCYVAMLTNFFTFTFPVNQVTRNWAYLPASWMQLRQQWEYSHAVSAGLVLIAFVLLLAGVLLDKDAPVTGQRPLSI
jgi:hypothetical protein